MARRYESQDQEHSKKNVSSIDKSPAIELKELPKHLKYVFLGENDSLPMIIASNLLQRQEFDLINTLKIHTKAIGWQMSDIQGISPAISMHRTVLEDNAKKNIEGQRRLDLIMMEVVKKEIIKWLDADIVYPISDIAWVSPVQCVPKKGGVTVISNDI